jgi:hypothetical protein
MIVAWTSRASLRQQGLTLRSDQPFRGSSDRTHRRVTRVSILDSHVGPVAFPEPDADGIYFIEPWQIAYYRFATGRITPMVALPEESIVAGPGLSLSPDRRWLLYGQRDRIGSDIMLLEGFR